ncbi:hypothetical protein F4823DRAFT_567628, partial [Ustulina deusta]
SGVETDSKEVFKFAKKQFQSAEEDSRWNGRQISNAFKIAKALAEFERLNGDSTQKNRPAVLTKSHLKQVARVTREFDNYLLEVNNGVTRAKYNKQHYLRSDDFALEESNTRKNPRRLARSRTTDLATKDLPSSSEEDSDSSASETNSSEDDHSSEPTKKSKGMGESSKGKKDKKKKSHNFKTKKTKKSRAQDTSSYSSYPIVYK